MAKTTNTNLDPGRVPPQNEEAERAVLGGILLEPEAIVKVIDILTPDDFYRPDHGVIYEACVDLFTKHQPIDLITLTDVLESHKKLKNVGGAAYLSSLVAQTTSTANIVHYAQIVQGKSVLRRLIQVANQINARAYDDEDDVINLLDNAEKSLFSVAERRLGANFIPVKNILSESFERIDELHRNRGTLRGVPTGFRELDDRLSGLQPSDLVIIAARPSMGKTALALNIAANAAIKHKKSVGIFSLEMSKEQLVDRLITMEAMIDSWRLRTGNLQEDDFAKINFAMGELGEAPLFIDDTPLLGVMEIKAKARRLQAEHGLDLIVVDYLQLMEGSRRGSNYESNRVQEVSEISRGLKGLARELKVPVLALSQLSRAVESRPGSKIPQLSDLRESGCLTGDTLVYLPKRGQYTPIAELEGKRDFVVAGINEDTLRVVEATATRAFCTGTKKVFALKTKLGREVKATGNHKFLTIRGWKRLDELQVGEHIALPRTLPDMRKDTIGERDIKGFKQYLSHHSANTNRDVIPKEIWRDLVVPRMELGGITTRQLHSRLGSQYCGTAHYKANISRDRVGKLAKILKSNRLRVLATSDIYWDQVAAVTPNGNAKVYDITVPGNHNFLAGDIVVHNSIEQDADVVMFIFREEYYEPDTEKKGIAQILIRKHRNGPTGEADLYFHAQYSRFADIERQSATPIESIES